MKNVNDMVQAIGVNKQSRKKGRAGGRTPGVLVPQETENRTINNEQTI